MLEKRDEAWSIVPSPPKVVTKSTFFARAVRMEAGSELVLWITKGRRALSEANSPGSMMNEILG